MPELCALRRGMRYAPPIGLLVSDNFSFPDFGENDGSVGTLQLEQIDYFEYIFLKVTVRSFRRVSVRMNRAAVCSRS